MKEIECKYGGGFNGRRNEMKEWTDDKEWADGRGYSDRWPEPDKYPSVPGGGENR